MQVRNRRKEDDCGCPFEMDSLVRGKDSFCRDDNDPMTFAVDGKDTYVYMYLQ